MTNFLEWWSLPFTIPFALAVLYLLLTITGITSTGETESAPDAGAAGDGPDGGAGDADHGDGPDDAGDGGPVSRLLDLLGLGRVPLAVALQLFLFVWGFAGWAANALLAPVLRAPAVFFWPSLLIAGAAALGATILLARPLARLMPSSESHGVAKRQLAGKIGTVVLPVSAAGGLVQVRDALGNVHQIACHTNGTRAASGGETISQPIPKGAEVIVVSYDADTDRYLVVESDLPRLRR